MVRPSPALFLLCAVLSAGVAKAAPVGHESWSARDGLPVKSVTDVMVGADGYVWVSTFDGLATFDGVRFRAVEPREGAWPSRRFVELHQADDGAVWAVTEQGQLVRYDPVRAAVASWDIGVRQGSVALVEGPAGTLWAAGANGVFSARGDAVTAVPLSVDQPLSVVETAEGLWVLGSKALVHRHADGTERTHQVESLGIGRPRGVVDVDGVWVVGNAGAVRMDATGPVPLLRDGAPWTLEILGLEAHPDGGLWVLAERGLFHWRDGRAEGPVAGDTGRPPLQGLGAVDPRGHQWLATRGAVLLDGQVVHRFDDVDASARALVADAEGNAWLATTSNGLHRFQTDQFLGFSRADGLVSDNVYAVHPDRNGGLWVGAQRGWLAHIRDGVVTRHGPESGAPEDVTAITRDRGGTLWVGSHDEGLFRWNDGALIPVDGLPSPLTIRALHPLPDGRLLVGSSAGTWSHRDGTWTALNDSIDPEWQLRGMLEVGDALYAATTQHGVVVFGPDGTASQIGSDILGSGLIRALWHDGEGLWVGTEDQGMRYVDASGRAGVALGPDEGLPDHAVHTLLPDEHGALWGSTNRGLFRIERQALDRFRDGGGPPPAVHVFTERDGLRDREGNGGTGHCATPLDGGLLAFASQGGVIVVDPKAMKRSGVPAPVRIETIEVDGIPRPAAASVRLAPSERSFGIAYTSLSYTSPERIQFWHQLEPLQSDWVDAQDRRTAWFTEIPPGTYTFRVRATNSDGEISHVIPTMTVVVEPHLWETTGFRLTALGVGLLGIAGLVWLRFAALRRRESELEAMVRERTDALHQETLALEKARATVADQADQLAEVVRLKTRYFANLSHEFRTPLTLVMGPLEDVRRGDHGPVPEAVGTQVARAEQGARHLFEMVNQLLDVVKLDVGQLTLSGEVHDLAAVVSVVVERLLPLAERRQIRLELATPSKPVPVWLDPRELPKVVTNLVSNALKFTDPGGSVRVSLTQDESTARLVVEDDGRGISEEEQARIFQRFYNEADSSVQPGSGLGLAMARELTELHGGQITVRSTLGEGSRFEVELPLSDAPTLPLHPDLSALQLPTLPESAPPTRATDPDGDRTTVLLVDDEPEIRAWVRGHLEHAYRVVEAGDGEEALASARAAQPDLVITDVMMPRLDGHGLVRALRADPELDWVPIVMLTARGSVDSQIDALERGADVYLTKPFSSAVLVAQVRGLIAQRQHLRERFGGAAGPASTPQGEVSADTRYLDAIHQAISERHSDPAFGVNELADLVHQDRTHLYRRLKALTGKTPSQLIRDHRLERAARLLARRTGTVGEVAYGVGFNSVAYFSTAFRKHFGLTPSAYARSPGEMEPPPAVSS